MKAKMLKIAGVKSEKEFYEKYPTEEAFMAKHGKAFKKAQIGTYMTSQASPTLYSPINTREMYDKLDYQVTGLTDTERKRLAAAQEANQQSDTSNSGIDFSQITSAAAQSGGPAKKGKKIPKAQGGIGYPTGPQLTPSTQNTQQQQYNWGTNYQGPYQQKQKSSSDFDPATAIPIAGQIFKGIKSIKEQKKRYKEAQQQTALTDVMADAAYTRPKQLPRRQYLRPEDVIVQPEQMFPSYGVGTNVLAQDGAIIRDGIGGTPTEIQNMYNPGTLYSDLGYEPLNDTSKMKNFQMGGMIGGGWSDVLGGVGSAFGASKVPGLPTALNFVGAALNRVQERKIENEQRLAKQNLANVIGQNVGMGIQNQFGAMMQDGGTTSPYEWVSHTWQPRTITQFGEYKMKDLLKPPADADMLRAGGHLREYTPPSPEAMQTDNFQMGGELQTHWGGYAEPISENPYLPNNGETVMFRGQSHDESDGRGNTGIGITYGDNPVEVERGEPAQVLKDGSTGEDNLTVFGNIKITNAFADMLADPKAKGKKFKSYVADLSKQENKQNKLMEKSMKQISDMEVITPFDQLKLATLQANLEGANAKLKDLADKKINAASLQNAINDTKEENLLNVTDKGDVLAKKGANIPKAQKGLTARADIPKQSKSDLGYGNISRSDIEQMKANNPWYDWSKFNPAKPEDVLKFQQAFNKKAEEIKSPARLAEDTLLGQQTVSARGLYGDRTITSLPRTAIPNLSYTLPTPSPTPSKVKRPLMTVPKGIDLAGILGQVLPYLRPSDVEQLDPNQLLGEMYALSQNQVEPVWAQKILPELGVPYDISLQDIMNQNQADYNATQRQVGYNPAALASLNAQKYAANQKVLGEQFRLNQAEKDKVYSENRNLLNQAKLQNLGILDQQYQRQSEALSKTKATTQAALNSITSKYSQNKLENRKLAVMENMYNFRYDPNFRLRNYQLAQFNTSGTPNFGTRGMTGGLAPGYEFTYDASGNIIGTRKVKSDDARNGAIVKNLKNL